MRSGFSTNAGIDIVITAVVYAAALFIALLIREAARSRVGSAVGERTPALAGRSSPGRETFDPLGSGLFPLFTAVTGAISYSWAEPLNFDLGRPGPMRRVMFSSLAGPASNLLVAALAARVLSPLTQSVLAGRLLGLFLLANLTMAVMHLLPVPMLDGGRIVSAFLSPSQRATFMRVEPWSIAILFGVALLGRYINNWPFAQIISAVRRLIA